MPSIQNWSSGCGPMMSSAGLLLHLGRAAGVVEVAVGDPDCVQRQALLRHRAQQGVDRAARIDDGGLHGLAAPDEGAVLLQRRDREDGDADGGGGGWLMPPDSAPAPVAKPSVPRLTLTFGAVIDIRAGFKGAAPQGAALLLSPPRARRLIGAAPERQNPDHASRRKVHRRPQPRHRGDHSRRRAERKAGRQAEGSRAADEAEGLPSRQGADVARQEDLRPRPDGRDRQRRAERAPARRPWTTPRCVRPPRPR